MGPTELIGSIVIAQDLAADRPDQVHPEHIVASSYQPLLGGLTSVDIIRQDRVHHHPLSVARRVIAPEAAAKSRLQWCRIHPSCAHARQ